MCVCCLQGRWIRGHVWHNLTTGDVCVYNCDVTISAQEVTNRILAQYAVIADRAAQGKTAGSIYTQLNDVESAHPLAFCNTCYSPFKRDYF